MTQCKDPFGARKLKQLRYLVLCALFTALNVVISTLFIPVGENLRIYFTFLPSALCGMICGPCLALCYGLVSDLVGFVAHPSGAFFPGYTLTAIVGALLYALFLHNTRITVLRVFLAKLSVNVLTNILMNSLWSSILMGKAFLYYLGKSVVKNLVMLPAEVAVLCLVIGLLLPFLIKQGLVPPQPTKLAIWKSKN